MDDQSPVKILKPISATLFTGDIIKICDEEDEGIGKAAKIKNLEITGIEFINKNQYIESDNCVVCQTFISEIEYCNVCGKTCCQPCSRKSLNSVQVCDICFYRAFMRSYRCRQDQILESKKNQANKLKQQTQEVQKSISENQNHIKKISTDYNTNTSAKQQISDQDSKINELTTFLNEKNKEYENLIQKQDDLTKQLEASLNDLSNKQYMQTTLGLDLQSAETSYGQKEQTFNSLSKQQKKIINSKSYLNCMKENNTDPAGNQLENVNPAKPSYDAEDFYKQGSMSSNQNYNKQRNQMRRNSDLLSHVTEVTEFPEKLSLMEQENKKQQQNEEPEKCCCVIF